MNLLTTAQRVTRSVVLGEVASVSQGLLTSGPGAGAKAGDWAVQLLESGDIQDDRLILGDLRTVDVQRNVKTERHLLRPYDVLVTARSTTIKSALVPPAISRTVAGATLLVVRPFEPELGVGQYLWYFFTSSYGRSQIMGKLTVGATIASLSARNLEEIVVPLPDPRHLFRLADLVEESESAYVAAVEAAQQRRTVVRDHIINTLREESRSSYVIDHI